MQFFKLVGAFAAGSGGQGRKRTADENVDLLAAKSEAFNKGLRGQAFFYVVNASGGTFTAMAVQKDSRMNMNPQFPAYTEALGVKLTDIHAQLFGYTPTLTQEERIQFLQIEFGRIGADSHITPREVIRDFIELLDIVYQNPQLNVSELLRSDSFSYAQAQPEGDNTVAPEFAEFDI